MTARFYTCPDCAADARRPAPDESVARLCAWHTQERAGNRAAAAARDARDPS